MLDSGRCRKSVNMSVIFDLRSYKTNNVSIICFVGKIGKIIHVSSHKIHTSNIFFCMSGMFM